MASKRSSSPKRRKGGGFPVKLVLYPLSVVLGLYLGVQAYANFLTPPAKTAKRKSAGKPQANQARAGKKTTVPPKKTLSDPKPGPAAAPQSEPDEEPEAKVTVRPVVPVQPFPPIEIDRGATGRPEVALTFDAGADWKPAKQILDTLGKNGVRTTFFLTGEWVERNPRTARRISEEGHEIGNHSWDHPAFTGLDDAQIKSQLERTEAVIRRTTGGTSRPYFRPPLGARDGRVRRVVGENGFLSIYWTLDSHDSVEKGITASQITERILKEIAPGSIVLLHCGSQATADALPELLAGLKQRGLQPVKVSQLLNK